MDDNQFHASIYNYMFSFTLFPCDVCGKENGLRGQTWIETQDDEKNRQDHPKRMWQRQMIYVKNRNVINTNFFSLLTKRCKLNYLVIEG